MRVLFSVLGLLALPQASSSLGEPFSLKIGETRSVEESGLSLKFVAVTRDSRCPRDVHCIVAGEAIVVLEARIGERETELEFHVPPGGSEERDFERFTIAIVVLEPEADSTRRIGEDDYVASVMVTEATAE